MEKLQLTFNNNYRTSHKIGQGTSAVFLGVSLNDDNKEVVVKLQKLEEGSTVEYEAKIYKMLGGIVGIPTLYWYGKEHGYSTLVIDVLGPSLCDLLRYCEGKFTLKTVLMIAEQAIQRLESIHSRGFVYRDVSPSNLLIGMGSKTDKIYLVDFELAERYTDIEGGHLAFGPSESRISKDLRFLSVHAHLRVKQSRRDDLESLGYVLIYFLNGTLPWSDISEENKELESLLIKERKVSCPIEVLCKGLPNQLGQYFKYAKTLEYEEEPDYQWIQRLLKDLFAECGFESNLIFDWAQNYHDKENKL